MAENKKNRTSAGKATVEAVLDWLEAEATEKARDDLLRYGIPNDNAFGVPMGRMLAYAKKRPEDPALASALWADGRYEPRTLAVLLDDPRQLSLERMDTMVADFDNWAICDTACFRLFDQAPDAWGAVPRWAAAEQLYTRRAGFALVWALALHDEAAGDAPFVEALALAETHAADPRPHVTKAISMAVRALGKRNAALGAETLAWAERLDGSGRVQSRLAREVQRELSKAPRRGATTDNHQGEDNA
jgi:3-methyladenine DNA glycosylase AlkD